MKNKFISQLAREKYGTGLALAASLIFLAASADGKGKGSHNKDAPFTRIYAFGDSLSDTGNFFALSGEPSAPYFEGRFSNGPVWIEYLAEKMGVDPGAVFSYAVGGATTGRDNDRDVEGVIEFPGLQDEIDYFVDDLDGRHADHRALYIVWAGANDFLMPGADPEVMINNTLTAIQRLHQVGARRFMVVNLPDLGLTPLGRLSGYSAYYSNLTAGYNAALDAALNQLDAAGIATTRVDSAGLIQAMDAEPEYFGLTNVMDSFLPIDGTSNFPYGDDPTGFLFWDLLHPTTLGHFFIAEEAMFALRRDFRHAWATPKKHRHQEHDHNRR